ncbi:MAG: autotransporter-associated beta strand repeat-containing protein, partial [Thermoguttaceae bacterium]
MVTETINASGYSIYVNGSLVSGGTGLVGKTPLFMQSGQAMGIGQDSGGEFFSGSLADVYVYPRALGANEVATLYNSVVAPNLSAVNALPIASPVTIGANATLDLNGYSQQVASLSDNAPGSGGSVINSNATVTPVLTLSAPGGSTTFSGAIQGAISLVMNGPGTQVLAGSNSYTGGTTITGGVLEAAMAASLPGYSTTGSVDVAGGVLAVQVGGANGWSSAQLGSLLANANWNNGAGALGIDTSNGNLSFGTAITQPLSLTKLGANTLTLTGSNTYTGLTTVSGGTLQLGDGTPGHDGSIAGNIANNASLVYNLSGNKLYAGVINGSGSLTKTGSGTLTLSGANNYSGATLVIGGTLKMQPAPFVPAGAVAAYTFADGATATDISGNGNNGTLNNSPTFVQGPGGPSSYAVSLDGASQYISVPFSPSLHVNQWTASAWVNLSASASSGTNGIIASHGLTYDLTYELNINNSNATVHSQIGPGEVGWISTVADATPAQPFNAGTWYMVTETVSSSGYNIYVDGSPVPGGSGTFSSAQLAGGPPLFMKGGQSLFIGQDSSGDFFSGSLADVYVYGRTLSPIEITALYNSVASPNLASNALPTGTPVIVAANATLDLNGYNQQVASLSDSASGVGGTVINSNAALTAVLTLSASGGSTTFSGAIQGPINLVMSGNGTQVLAGSNTYSGGTTISQGVLDFLNTAAQPSSGTVTVAAGATLGLGVGPAPTYFTATNLDGLFGVSGGSISRVSANPASIVGIDTTAGNFTYSSNIPASAMGLTKLGANTLTLTGSNSYTGVTTISGGTLQLGDGTQGHDGIALTGNIVNNAALVYNLNGNQNYAGQINGSGSVTKTGNGTLTLSGANYYSGPTLIIGGTLKMQPAGGTPSGAVAAYTFADDTATDVSGNGNNGTLNNSPTFGPGPGAAGQSLVLDGSQAVSVPYSSSLSNL